MAFGTSAYSSLLLTWSFQVNPDADLSSVVKQPSIFFASVFVSVHATLPYMKTKSTFEQNSRVLVFLDSVDLQILLILLCSVHAGSILFAISAFELLTRDIK